MIYRKTLEELTLKDNFMFSAVMCDGDNCRRLLELVLDFPIAYVEVSKEKSIVYHPEYKGVRLDVYAEDENRTHYNVEMQAVAEPALGKRTRYYHSQIDMDQLAAGADYLEISDSYVIFICDFDPFGRGKYRYTFHHDCQEDPTLRLDDGAASIFLSTRGTNTEEVPQELVKFLKYVRADLEESMKDFEDDYVDRLQKAVQNIKQSRRMEERYMLTELLMQDERRAGRAEGRIEGRIEGRVEGRTEGHAESILLLLRGIGSVSEELQAKIMKERDLNTLRNWLKLAAKVDSIEQFMREM